MSELGVHLCRQNSSHKNRYFISNVSYHQCHDVYGACAVELTQNCVQTRCLFDFQFLWPFAAVKLHQCGYKMYIITMFLLNLKICIKSETKQVYILRWNGLFLNELHTQTLTHSIHTYECTDEEEEKPKSHFIKCKRFQWHGCEW